MRKGREIVIRIISRTLRLWISNGDMMLEFPVSLRSLCARRFKITGAYVSGIKITNGKLAPVRISPIQKHQRQLTTATNPETHGPMMGPNVVHFANVSFTSNYSALIDRLR